MADGTLPARPDRIGNRRVIDVVKDLDGSDSESWYFELEGSGMVSTTATVHPTVQLWNNIKIGAGARVDAHVIIYPNCQIGRNALLGEGCILGFDVIVDDEARVMSWGKRLRNGTHVQRSVPRLMPNGPLPVQRTELPSVVSSKSIKPCVPNRVPGRFS